MTNNLQVDDDSLPALVSAGEDLTPEEGSKGEESQGVTSGNKVQTTFMWYHFSPDISEPVTLLSSEKVRRNISARIIRNRGIQPFSTLATS